MASISSEPELGGKSIWTELRKNVYGLLEDPRESAAEVWVRGGIQVLIVLNGIAVVLQSMESLGIPYQRQFQIFEYASVGIFTIEYLARMISCTVDPRYASSIVGRLRFAARPMNLIDLVAIAPAYLPLFMGADLRILRILRITRAFRLLKMGRYSTAVQRVGTALVNRAPELAVTVLGGFLILALSSTLLYHVEHDAQPELFSSIPASSWAAISTLTPVGSGSVNPITPLGRFVAALSALIGIGIFAIPAGILAKAFTNEADSGICPHCGKATGAEGGRVDG